MKANLSLWFLPVLIGLNQFAAAQNVVIPDANFKNYLLSVPAINTNSDGEIQAGEASVFSGTINANNKSISDLSGIEAFTSLTGLDCSNNQITGLNFTSNTSLKTLLCGNNNLTGVNILSNTMLTTLSCENNNLPNINVANNAALTSLTCNNNQLTTIYLLNNPSLTYLNCQNNQITGLDLYANPLLKEIRGYNNQLTYMNAQNGNNNNLTAFYAYNNASLTCIQVDNVTYMNTNWSAGKDPGAFYSSNCPLSLGIATIDNDTKNSVYPNPSSGIFTIRSNSTDKQTANLYDVNGKLAFNRNITGNTEIDVNDLNDGMYTLILRSADSVTAKKVVIAR